MAGKKRIGSKGLELPLNMIVLIIVAVLVLLVIAAYFTGQFASGSNTIADTAALDRGCISWRAVQCNVAPSSITIPNYNPTGNTPLGASLDVACTRSGSPPGSTPDQCRVRCGCPA